MFLSIVIPIWNDEKLLNECLDSCLNQDLSKDDYEIICVDDGSTDRTPEILREYAESFPNIRVIVKEHTGFGGRAAGLKAAKGDYLWFVDHDDIVAPHAVDELKKVVAEHGNYERFQFPCYKFFDALTEEERERIKDGTLRLNFTFPPLDWFTWSSILKVSFLRENNIIPWSQRIQEAGDFWGIETFEIWGGDWAFMDECKDYGIRTFSLSEYPLYYYRVHEESATKASSPKAVAERKQLRYNMALYRAHRAWVQKQQYLSERAQKGRSSAEAAEKLVDKLRDAVRFLFMQPADQQKQGVKQFLGKDIFLDKRPEEYQGSFRSYRKSLSKKEKLLPHVNAFYYCYTKSGLRVYSFCFRLFSFIKKVIKRK